VLSNTAGGFIYQARSSTARRSIYRRNKWTAGIGFNLASRSKQPWPPRWLALLKRNQRLCRTYITTLMNLRSAMKCPVAWTI
jgi:hypothetical protein